MFPVTFNVLQFNTVVVYLGHLADVRKSIIFIKASEIGQMIFNESPLVYCNYKLQTSELRQVWRVDLGKSSSQ